jgi:hypothetical protein
MENSCKNMNSAELESLLKKTQEKIENSEDERDIILGQSQSGQHTGSKIIQSRIKKIDAEIKSLQDAAAEITEALENKAKEI